MESGETPHLIVNQLHRSKLDPNRDREEAAMGDFQAETAYDTYHGSAARGGGGVDICHGTAARGGGRGWWRRYIPWDSSMGRGEGMVATIYAMGQQHGEGGGDGGVDSYHGSAAWGGGGVDSYHGTAAWGGGVDRCHGTAAWGGVAFEAHTLKY